MDERERASDLAADRAALSRRDRVALVTQGCKVNQYETQVLRESFLARGWELVDFGSRAELTVINSCTVTAGSDRDLRRLVSRARRASADGRILITGCRVHVDAVGAAALPGVDYVVDNLSKERIPSLATDGLLRDFTDGNGPESFPDLVTDEAITRLDGRGRAFLKVQDGCNLRCSFCIVPYARGDSRSRRADEAITRARLFESHGYRELVLSGIQLGFYRDPAGAARDLESLLRLLLDGTERLRFRLGSLLPLHVTPGLCGLLSAEPQRLCPHLHVSLQSGDDAVLSSMKRPYRRELYRKLLADLSEELPEPCLGTDIIVGFPGEDALSFERTYAFLETLPLAYGHVFPFSARKGTPAAQMGDPVPRDEKARRGRLLRELLAAKGLSYRERQRGRRLRVVVEKRNGEDRWQGTSETYQKVFFAARQATPGSIVTVEVTGVETGGKSLAGREIVSDRPDGAL